MPATGAAGQGECEDCDDATLQRAEAQRVEDPHAYSVITSDAGEIEVHRLPVCR